MTDTLKPLPPMLNVWRDDEDDILLYEPLDRHTLFSVYYHADNYNQVKEEAAYYKNLYNQTRMNADEQLRLYLELKKKYEALAHQLFE
jgi:hypothetical protein